MTKGVRHIPNAATERVLAAIASIESEEFCGGDVVRLVPDLIPGTVYEIVRFKARQGGLERVGYRRYRKGGTKLPLKRLPAGLVSDAIWTVLFTDPERKFWRCGELIGEVESLIGRPGYTAKGSVSSVLYVWNRDGFMERNGQPKEFGHRLKEGVNERPLTRAVIVK